MKTCLVVDDSSIVRKVARRIVEGWDSKSSRRKTASKRWRSARRHMPEAVLLDWNMPVMDGFEFLGRMRRLPGGDEPKVVFCTTENSIGHIAKAMGGGANEYIMKPFDKEIIAGEVRKKSGWSRVGEAMD